MNKYDQMTKIKRIIESCKTLEQLHQTRPILERFRITYVKSDNTDSFLCAKELRKAWRAKSNQFETVATKHAKKDISTED